MIWIVCPCYFDVASFERLRDEVGRALAGKSYKIVLIDDTAGQDPEIARVAGGNVEVLTPPYNLGHQRALVFALRALADRIDERDQIVTMDADGEDKPEDIGALLQPLEAAPDNLFKVALAQRTRRKETLAFKVLYGFYKLFFRALAGTVIRSGNFVAYRGWLLRNMIFHPFFDYCYSSSFIALPLQVAYVPIARGTRYAGRSKMGFISLVSHGFRMLLPFSERIAIRFIIFAVLLSLAGVAGGATALVLRAQGNPNMLPWALVGLAAVIVGLFVGSTSFIFFATANQARAASLRSFKRD